MGDSWHAFKTGFARTRQKVRDLIVFALLYYKWCSYDKSRIIKNAILSTPNIHFLVLFVTIFHILCLPLLPNPIFDNAYKHHNNAYIIQIIYCIFVL